MAKRARPKPARPDRKPRRQPPAAVPALAPVVFQPRPAPPPGPDPAALELFRLGMEALQRHAFEEAAGHFRAVQAGFQAERALLDRVNVYLELCDRQVTRRPPEPRTLEERLTAATAALNNRDEAAAAGLVRSALAEQPEHELALYLMAVVEARAGRPESALEWLARAVTASPEVQAQARHDADFEALQGLEVFRQLTESRLGPAGHAGRRPRRPRADR